MKRIAVVSAICLALILPAAPTPADELNTRWVAPDAEWVMHVDLEALFKSPLGSLMLEEGSPVNLREARDELQTELGIDLVEDLLGLTAYGRSDWGESGVLIATTTRAADDVLAAVREEAENYSAREVGPYTLHSFDADGSHVCAYIGQRGEGRVVVMSDDDDIVLHALGVMRDRDVSNSAIRVPARAILFATATDLDRLPEFEPTSQVLSGASDISLAVTEDADHNIVTKLSVGAESAQQARDISDVVNGLLALGRLAAGQDDELEFVVDLMNGIKVNADGSQLTLSIALSAEMLKEIAEQADGQDFQWDWNGRNDAENRPRDKKDDIDWADRRN